MAFIIKDRVKENTTTTGTGAITLGGAAATFDTFQSYMVNGDTTYYAIVSTETNTDEWEVGLGTWNTGNTLTRTTVLAGSNGTNAVNFGSGSKDVFMTYPAAHAALAGDDVDFANITVSGTVDGRDVAADGTKLDTVEQNADVTDAVNVAAAGALMKSGGTMTGALILNADPTTALGAATKEYVDTIASAGIHYHDPVRVETPSALTSTYNNGSSGVGATLTNSGTQAALVIDGVTMALNDRVLVYNQTNEAHNGIYTVTNVGSATANWVMTRATDADSYGASDPNSFGKGDAFFVKEGNTGAGELYVMTTAGEITFGTTAIHFSQVAETAIYNAGTGLTLTGTTFSIGQDVATTANVTFNQVTAAIIGNVTGNLTGDVTGNADTATALETARTIQLSGDVTGSASFDGSANINITAAVQDDSHAHTISNVDGLQTALDDKTDTTRTLTAGNGLTGGGDLSANRTFNVGAGAGITVGATTVAHADTSTQSSVNNSGRTYIQDITLDGFGHVTGLTSATETVTDTNQLTTFVVEDGDGTEVTISHGKEWKFVEGGGIDINWTDISTGSDGNPYDLTIKHVDTSNQTSVDNSNGVVIQDVTLDTYGHVTGLGSVDLDGRYVNVTGDTMTGALTLQRTLGDITHLTLKQQNTSGDISSQKAFIDFTFVDSNANGTPQVRIGANVGEDGGDANTQLLEGSGEFVVYTATGTTTSANSLTEKFRVSHDGKLFAGSNRVFAENYHPNADKWTTARTLTLSGDASGSVSWDGSANATLSVAVANDSHTHDGRYYTESEADSRFVRKGVGYTWTAVGSNALSFRSNDQIDTANGDQASLEVLQDTAGADAFMQFHVAGDYAKYFGLHGGINDFVVGGWSYGSGYQRIFHDGYHPNADKWTTARSHTVTLTGEVTGSASQTVDGSGNKTWSIATTLNHSALNDQYVNITGDTMTGVLTINNTSDAQLLLQSTNSWTGIGFNDSGSNNEYIWHNGANGTFAIGGGGSNVAGKKLHVDGGMSVGSSSDATSTPTQGIYSEGGISIAGTIGTRDNTLSIVGDANSGPIAAKVSQYDTVFSVLPWSSGITYLSSGTYYDSGSWVHASSNTDSALIAFSGDGVSWYSSSNSSGSWNVASDVDLWNSSGTWVSGVAKSPTLTLSGDASGSATFTNLGNATLNVTIANDSHTHDSRYTLKDEFDWRGTGYLTSTTTSALKTELLGRDVFDSYVSAFKTGWSYAGNGNLTDAGRLTELAGTSWLTWTDNSSDNVQGNFTALVIAPNTGGSAGKMFVYNDQGSSYAPGWREIWTSTSDGSGSGLDADLLDGNHASAFALSGHNHTYNVNNAWLRENGDNAHFKQYGNSRQMVFRTDGTTEYSSGVGGYPFVWMYGGDASTDRRMILNTSGQLWCSNYGWLHDKFADASHTHSNYITSNANDNVTGHTEWQDNYEIRLGNGADFRMWHNGSHHYFRNYHHSAGNFYFQGENTSGTNHGIIYLQCDTARTYARLFENSEERLRTTETGITVYGDVNSTSDIRYKKNIETIDNAVDKVKALRGVTFDWDNEAFEATGEEVQKPSFTDRATGVIAQDVEKVLPEAVREDAETGFKNVSYGNMVGLLIEAIKEQQEQIDMLTQKLNEMENK